MGLPILPCTQGAIIIMLSTEFVSQKKISGQNKATAPNLARADVMMKSDLRVSEKGTSGQLHHVLDKYTHEVNLFFRNVTFK